MDNAIDRVRQGPVGQRQNGPFEIIWETNDASTVDQLWEPVAFVGELEIGVVLETLHENADVPILRTLYSWLSRQRSTRGIEVVSAVELRDRLIRLVSLRRQYGGVVTPRFVAMTIQQAKNREFDHVIIMWPYQVPNDDEKRRRLLYNAITRARRSCTILAQSQDLLDAAPFG